MSDNLVSFVALVTGRGRINIPKNIRALLGLEPGDTVNCSVKLLKKKEK